MSSQHTDNPAIVYQQIEHQAEEESCPQQDEVEMVYSAENQAIIDNSTKWVFLLVTVQMLISIPEWGSSTFGTFFPYFNLFMAVLGWVGVRRQHLGLIVSHFLYSMLCLFGLVMVFSLVVFYATTIRLEWLAILTCVILASSFLLRKQRLLIQALCTKKVPMIVDTEDPMVVDMPMTPLEAAAAYTMAPPSAPSMMGGDQMSACYPAFPKDQPIPMIVQTETGNQVVYMYPVMPNPQFAPAPATAPVPVSAPADDVQQLPNNSNQ
jgi:hypothetical protein